MKNVSDGPILRLNTAKGRISELEDRSVKLPKLKSRGKEKKGEKQNKVPKNCGTFTKV